MVDDGFDWEAHEVGDCDLMEILTPGGAAPVGVDSQGLVYVSGDLHPGGPIVAAAAAMASKVPWVQFNAVEILYPAAWLLGEVLGSDARRAAIITSIERHVRGSA